MGGLGATVKRYQEKSTTGFAKTGNLAEEVISCIRNVTAFGSQRLMLRKYEHSLAEPVKDDFMAKLVMGFFIAIMMFILNTSNGLAFWQGNRFLHWGDGDIAGIITVLFTAGLSGILLGHAAPFVAAIAQAGAAASRLFAIIDRQSPIDPLSDDGRTLDDVEGAIEFRNIKFKYPSRSDQTILEDFSLSVPAGKTIAIVGPSGSGKTTLFSLIERFYPALKGEIRLDGHPIQGLNTRWFRSQIGLVAQDNFLFNTTVLENIAYGLGVDYGRLSEGAVLDRVQEAAKLAKADLFIKALPEGYHTKVGERGSQLSGGQRQRVAIARAIVSRPKILLLDEATAALDTRSERLVQDALQAASKDRTTIIIAHRLSTIQKADMIMVLDHGKVVEQGSHEELLATSSTYASLVKAQQLSKNHNAEKVEEVSVNDEVDEESRALLPGQKGEVRPRAKDHEQSLFQLTGLVWKLNQREKYHMFSGLICSVLAGAGSPTNGIFFGNAIIAMTDPALSTGGRSLNFWALMYLMLGIVLLLVYSIQGYCFAVAGSALGRRSRAQAFESILRQDMAFFDREGNTSGSLAAFLSIEATKLTGISGNTMGAIANAIMTLVSAVAISCSFGWKLGLVASSMIPILLSCGFLRFWVVTKIERRFKAATRAGAIASEAVSAIRTVAALTLETTINGKYAECLQSTRSSDLMNDFASAFFYALSQTLPIFVNALLFWYGGIKLIGTGEYTVQEFFICFLTVTFGATAAGSLFSYAPEIAGARAAAARLKDILESTPSMDAESETGVRAENLAGDIDLQSVEFAYPSRPQQKVLQQIDLAANRGHFVALVGGSGSGKSTILNLIERFYDPCNGVVRADKQDIRDLNLASLRSQIALVEQEAPLIGGTLRDCLISDDETIHDQDIELACRSANIHEFIISLPEGYNTIVGARGNRLSGGQKQRIAIAKALLRDPKILLLDEATSALDSESERLVRNAIDSASHGRTTISVAHRLSSIAHAQRIYVFDHGSVVEFGTHDELMERGGKYFELVTLQNIG
ncbi:putative multidrug resistance protein 1, 2 [Dactylonectria estremocensis]|uniref:Multidrug resistance protein 1, 2 n=1 Tax=Dactylonectria estremocensis TaxID=1079267 RepID=A0A9P9ILE5_9HYPO|nr:putative multidrug resistance protein 1, 2 [Dactylonectria estremocensis]